MSEDRAERPSAEDAGNATSASPFDTTPKVPGFIHNGVLNPWPAEGYKPNAADVRGINPAGKLGTASTEASEQPPATPDSNASKKPRE